MPETLEPREAMSEAQAGREPPTCPVEAALRLIGGKYKGLILWHLTGGAMRYGALSRLVAGATPKMLTQQLRELERDGLVSRAVFPVVPPRVEYALTPSGETLAPVLHALYDWGVGLMRRNGWEVRCSMRTGEG